MERDDIVEYSLNAHHSEEEGVKIRKNIYFVTLLLSVITAIEVGVGVVYARTETSPQLWEWIKWGYIVLTLIKAGYIVMEFMHLGHERRSLKLTILVPYIVFILYLIFICLYEAIAVGENMSF